MYTMLNNYNLPISYCIQKEEQSKGGIKKAPHFPRCDAK